MSGKDLAWVMVAVSIAMGLMHESGVVMLMVGVLVVGLTGFFARAVFRAGEYVGRTAPLAVGGFAHRTAEALVALPATIIRSKSTESLALEGLAILDDLAQAGASGTRLIWHAARLALSIPGQYRERERTEANHPATAGDKPPKDRAEYGAIGRIELKLDGERIFVTGPTGGRQISARQLALKIGELGSDVALQAILTQPDMYDVVVLDGDET